MHLSNALLLILAFTTSTLLLVCIQFKELQLAGTFKNSTGCPQKVLYKTTLVIQQVLQKKEKIMQLPDTRNTAVHTNSSAY